MEGCPEGSKEGMAVEGAMDGDGVGFLACEGTLNAFDGKGWTGALVGDEVGRSVGLVVGRVVGDDVGEGLGGSVGCLVGEVVGCPVG